MKRILIFNWRDINHEWAGGGEVYIHELAKRWVKMGNDVTLFCGQDINRKLPNEEIIDGIRVVRRGGRFSVYLWAVWYYMSRLRKTCDIVVDVQNGIPFFTVLYSRKPKIAVVYHIHDQQFFIELPFPYDWIGYITEKYIFPFLYKGIHIQVISKTTKNDILKRGIDPRHVHVVYCGINGNRVAKTSYSKFAHPTILYLGRIKKYKRVETLVHILPAILKRIPRVQLMIAGWGTEASSVTDLSMRSSMRKRIHIIGPVSESEKKRLLQKSWVFVNPSMNEGWGISVIEANLYGTPAVAFRVQGLSESILHGKTGLLANNENEFIDYIVQLLSDKKLRDTLGVNAKRRAIEFSWDKAACESLELLIGAFTND